MCISVTSAPVWSVRPSFAAGAHFGLALGSEASIPESRKSLELFLRHGRAVCIEAVYKRRGDTAKPQETPCDYERNKLLLPRLNDPDVNRCPSLKVSAASLRPERKDNYGRRGDVRFGERAPTPGMAARLYVKYVDRVVYGTDMVYNQRMFSTIFRIVESTDQHFYEQYLNFNVSYHWRQAFDRARNNAS